MTWASLDDQFPEHPKIDALTDGAFRLHVAAICYANRHLTDGLIPAERLPRLVPRYKRSYVVELVDRLVWVELAEGTHFAIHDFLDWNKSRAEIEQRRQARSDGGRKGAGKRWGRE